MVQAITVRLPVSYSAGPLGEYDEVGYLLDAEGVVLSRFDRTNGGDEIGALLCNFVNAHYPMLEALEKVENALRFLCYHDAEGEMDKLIAEVSAVIATAKSRDEDTKT